MSSRLDWIANLEGLAETARYSPKRLASACRVSLRQLERFTIRTFGRTPHRWLYELRMQRALELVRDRTSLKETGFMLGYKDVAHFSHDFKKFFGIPPGRAQFVVIPPLFPPERPF